MTLDVSHRVAEGSKDELGRLRRAFNQLLEELEISQDSQRQLILDASHELRTPLTSLRANAQVLSRLDELDGDDVSQLSDDMVTQVDELTRLVGDLTELTRGRALRRGGARPRPRGPDRRVRRDRRDPRAHQAGHGRVRLGAVQRCTQSATESCAPSGTSSTTRSSSPRGRHRQGGVPRRRCVTVDDSGPGIADADVPFVFDRFYRSSTSRGLPGSGLGLAIVAQVVSEAGGTVTAGRSSELAGRAHGDAAPAGEHPTAGSQRILSSPSARVYRGRVRMAPTDGAHQASGARSAPRGDAPPQRHSPPRPSRRSGPPHRPGELRHGGHRLGRPGWARRERRGPRPGSSPSPLQGTAGQSTVRRAPRPARGRAAPHRPPLGRSPPTPASPGGTARTADRRGVGHARARTVPPATVPRRRLPRRSRPAGRDPALLAAERFELWGTVGVAVRDRPGRTAARPARWWMTPFADVDAACSGSAPTPSCSRSTSAAGRGPVPRLVGAVRPRDDARRRRRGDERGVRPHGARLARRARLRPRHRADPRSRRRVARPARRRAGRRRGARRRRTRARSRSTRGARSTSGRRQRRAAPTSPPSWSRRACRSAASSTSAATFAARARRPTAAGSSRSRRTRADRADARDERRSPWSPGASLRARPRFAGGAATASTSTTSSTRGPARRQRRPGRSSPSPPRACAEANALSTAAIVWGDHALFELPQRGAAARLVALGRHRRARRRMARRGGDVIAADLAVPVVPLARHGCRLAVPADRS